MSTVQHHYQEHDRAPRSVLNRQSLGRLGEQMAARYLEMRGFRILERNWQHQLGELDLIAVDAETIVAVEVKTRSSTDYGHPLEAITTDKVKRLRRLLLSWVREQDGVPRRLRIDAIGILLPAQGAPQVRHLRGIA